MNPAIIQNFAVRRRNPPIDRVALYGEYAPVMSRGEKLHQDTADRAAYTLITGYFPSHLRARSTRILTQITMPYRRPTSLDGRRGARLVKADAIQDLDLNSHDMVKAVRHKVGQRFMIEPSRGPGTRRGFGKVFMFKRRPNRMIYDKITVTLEGAVKQGWD